MPLAAGTRLGPYEILAAIGAGGMGEVYRARDTRLRRDVALKLLPQQFAGYTDRRVRFEREARAVSALSHPRISALYDIGEHEGAPYLVMEFLAGETLASRLRRGPLPVAQAALVAAEIAEGLSAAHKQGIIHRDLKPSNVMLTKDGAKLLDFGIAKVDASIDPLASTTEALTGAGIVLGTWPYMAPEQLEGKPHDARTDIWALGAILYEMLAGRRAFQGDTSATLTLAILEREPEPLASVRPDTAPSLDRLVRRCLAKDPDARWDTAHDVADELMWIAHGTGALDVVQSHRGHRQQTLRLVAFGIACTMAGAGIAWLVTGGVPGFGNGASGANSGARVAPVSSPRQLTSSPGWETAPAISPDGSLFAYVSDEAGQPDIWVSGVGGTNPLRLTSDAATEEKPCWYPDGRTLAFVSDRDGRKGIWKIPTLGGSATMLVPDAWDPAIDPSGTRIAFVTTDAGRIAVADLSDPLHSRVLTHADDGVWFHRDPAWSPDGRTIAYAAQRGLWTVSASGGDATRLTTDDEADEEPSWSPEGRFVYFSSSREGTQAIWRMAIPGGTPERVTLGSGPETHPSLSRNGHEMLFTTAFSTSDIVVRELASGRETVLPSARQEYQPSFSRDARHVLFGSDRAGGFRIWDQPLSEGIPAGPPRMVVDHHGASPRYSPDGRWICYYRVEKGQPRAVWLVPAEGGAARRLLESPGQQVHPAWSPRGRSIAFVSEQDGAGRILVADVEGGTPTGTHHAATPDTGTYQAPEWSPDGTRLAYIAVDKSGNADVWVTVADGTGRPRRLTAGGTALRVKWHPRSEEWLVSATVGKDIVVLRVPRDGGTSRPLNPFIRLGTNQTLIDFDVSSDGRWFTYARESAQGDVWMVEVGDK